MGFNHVQLVGRLVADPELRHTQSGDAVVGFRLAVDRNFSKEADFFGCTAWRKTAAIIAEYCRKGSQVAIYGSIQNRKYQTREGEDRTVTEVQVQQVQLLGSPKEGGVTKGEQNNPDPGYSNGHSGGGLTAENDDDLPF
jgi:single-strand DNA-binding protein